MTNNHRYSSKVYADEMELMRQWKDSLVNPVLPSRIRLELIKNGYGKVQESISYAREQLCLGGRKFENGLACHADSDVRVKLPGAAKHFHASVGIDENEHTLAASFKAAQVVFSIETGGREIWHSQPLALGMNPVEVNLPLGNVHEMRLKATAVNGDIRLAHSDWADARVQLTDGRELALARDIEEARIPSNLPFSFNCGRPGSEWVDRDNAQRQSGDWHAGKREHRLTWHDAMTGLACDMELVEFENFPAMEWVLHFRNAGKDDTPVLSDVCALNIIWQSIVKKHPLLHRSRGSDAAPLDFQYQSTEVHGTPFQAERVIRMNAALNQAARQARAVSPDHRPSAEWLPFFNLQTGGDGLIIALGWNGQWFAEFAEDGEPGCIKITAGMESLRLKLHPGESIRSPRILLLYWKGEPIHGHNLLRKFILDHHTPQRNGKPVETPLCNATWGGTPTAGHLEMINVVKKQKLPYDYYWVDAGWYGTSTLPSPNVFAGQWCIGGDWRINRTYHPDGLKPIADAAHAAGMKFLLWVEPESATQGTPVTLEHPDWFLKKDEKAPQPKDHLFLDLGNPAAWRWAVETVSGLISANGIDCYREDFNADPFPYWQAADEPDRQGITEIRFVEGLYAFWDELLRRHPGLLIDNCASGGRRIELETISRSIALWRSDYNCFPWLNTNGLQLHGLGLSHWVPLHATSPFAAPGDTYQVRSAMAAGLVLCIDECGNRQHYKSADYPWDWHRKMMHDFQRARPYFYGDFYPLTPCILDAGAWLAYQLHRPDLNTGLIMAFRREQSPLVSASFQLQGLSADKAYEFEDADSGKKWRAQGGELASDGLVIKIDKPRMSRLIFYT